MKKINNIVFYDFTDDFGPHTQVCLFFEDGSVKSISEDEGELAKVVLAKQEGVNIKNIQKTKKIHHITGEELEKEFQNYRQVQTKERPTKVNKKKSPGMIRKNLTKAKNFFKKKGKQEVVEEVLEEPRVQESASIKEKQVKPVMKSEKEEQQSHTQTYTKEQEEAVNKILEMLEKGIASGKEVVAAARKK